MGLTQFGDRWGRLNELFHQALSLPSNEVEAFLEHATGDDESLRDFLRELVAATRTGDEQLRQSIGQLAHDVASAEILTGRRLGAYRIDSLLARGGMGAVYLASRADGEFEKKVAIKIVHKRLNRDELVRHFRTERQMLANLSHPSIPALVDAGQLEDGRPYFICEYVDGIPIDEYCEQNTLSRTERIALLTQVGEALQHAHNNLILHLDIKPDNVLVQQDGTPSLLDFGIARLMSEREIGHEAITPEYASPERIRGELPTVASDVYSLGLLLYRLLLNETPVSAPRFAPSKTQLADRARLADTMNQPDELSGIDGELSAILRKATAMDPAGRYASVDWFLRDLKYHRLNLPVSAKRKTLTYRLEKYLRRHRVAVLAALLGFVLSAVFGLREAEWHREQQVARNLAEEASLAAAREAETARQVSTLLTELFEISDPGEARGNSVTARELLDRGAERVARDLADRPLIAVKMMRVIGTVYIRLGLYDRAVGLLEEALTLSESMSEVDAAELGWLLCVLGDVYLRQGELDKAEYVLYRSLEVRERFFGTRHEDVADSLTQIGRLRFVQNRFEEGESPLLRAIRINERTLGPDSDAYAESLRYLALCYRSLGRREEAERLLTRAIAIRERALGPSHHTLVNPLDNLANLYRELGRNEASIALHERGLGIIEKTLSATHPRLATKLNNLAIAYKAVERYDEAEPLLLRSLAIREEMLGLEHPQVSTTLNALGTLYQSLGRLDEAERLLLRSLAVRETASGPDDPRVGVIKHNLGDVYLARGELETAERLLLEALAIWNRKLKPSHIYYSYGDWKLANVYREQGRYREAIAAYDKAYGTLVQTRGNEDADVIRLATDYARLLRMLDRHAEADALLSR